MKKKTPKPVPDALATFAERVSLFGIRRFARVSGVPRSTVQDIAARKRKVTVAEALRLFPLVAMSIRLSSEEKPWHAMLAANAAEDRAGAVTAANKGKTKRKSTSSAKHRQLELREVP